MRFSVFNPAKQSYSVHEGTDTPLPTGDTETPLGTVPRLRNLPAGTRYLGEFVAPQGEIVGTGGYGLKDFLLIGGSILVVAWLFSTVKKFNKE